MKHVLLLSLLLGSCGALRHQPANVLLEADRAFARDSRERRLEAWLAAFDADGAQADEQFRLSTGHAALRANMAPFFDDPANELEWEPDTATLSEAGNVGSTSGRFRMTRKRADGAVEVVATGRYFDVWRKLPDGSWKIAYEASDSDPQR